jgi:hypothetical protein
MLVHVAKFDMKKIIKEITSTYEEALISRYWAVRKRLWPWEPKLHYLLQQPDHDPGSPGGCGAMAAQRALDVHLSQSQ